MVEAINNMEIPGRRKSFTPVVFGLLNILWALLGMFYCLWVFIRLHLAMLNKKDVPFAVTMKRFPEVGTIQLSIAGLMFILAMILIIAGIGLIKKRQWGRKLSGFYVIAKLLLILVNETVFFWFIINQWTLISDPKWKENGVLHIFMCEAIAVISLFYPALLGAWLIFSRKNKYITQEE